MINFISTDKSYDLLFDADEAMMAAVEIDGKRDIPPNEKTSFCVLYSKPSHRFFIMRGLDLVANPFEGTKLISAFIVDSDPSGKRTGLYHDVMRAMETARTILDRRAKC